MWYSCCVSRRGWCVSVYSYPAYAPTRLLHEHFQTCVLEPAWLLPALEQLKCFVLPVDFCTVCVCFEQCWLVHLPSAGLIALHVELASMLLHSSHQAELQGLSAYEQREAAVGCCVIAHKWLSCWHLSASERDVLWPTRPPTVVAPNTSKETNSKC